MPYLGEICALGTALCWTASSTAFAVASRAVGPLPANHFRLVAALPCLLLLAWAVVGQPWPVAASSHQMWVLVASGLAGLVLGDLGYFYALAKIGPRLCSVLMATWPACTVAMEAAVGRLPTAAMLLGIATTMVGVALVLLRSGDQKVWQPDLPRRQWWLGIGGALLGAIGQAGGFVLAGYGMAADGDAAAVPPLLATVVRMVTATLGLQLVLVLQRVPFAAVDVCRNALALRAALLGAVFGPIGGVWLSMVARQQAHDAGIASALMATTPVFMMPVAYGLYGARIGRLGLLGTLVATAGVAWCFLARPAA
ncbi:MAG: DMT family transporter [Planctomycetes bacterium]|nr:DMT family transporter [Planctomycetota bacterium]